MPGQIQKLDTKVVTIIAILIAAVLAITFLSAIGVYLHLILNDRQVPANMVIVIGGALVFLKTAAAALIEAMFYGGESEGYPSEENNGGSNVGPASKSQPPTK